MSGRKVDLHLSKSKTIKELNYQATAAVGGNTNSNPMLLMKSLDKLYEAGQKSQIDGDEEKAYVFFMRFLEIYTHTKNSVDFKKDPNYFNKKIDIKRVTDCLTMSEKLADSLKQRYELVKRSEREMKDTEENHKIRLVKSYVGIYGKSLNANVKEKSNELVGIMTISNLKLLLEQKSTRLLIIDCRAKDDFTRAHLNHPNCICIPSELLHPGISAKEIENELRKNCPESYTDWTKRGEFDRVILYDWNSTFENQQCSIQALYTAMTRWDLETEYNIRPCILQGGVRTTYYTYPTLIKRPLNIKDPISREVEPSKNQQDTIFRGYPTLPVSNEKLIKQLKEKQQEVEKLKKLISANEELTKQLKEKQQEVNELKKLVSAKEDLTRCLICQEEEMNFVLSCGHPFCGKCIEQCTYCPNCREKVTNMTKIFWPM